MTEPLMKSMPPVLAKSKRWAPVANLVGKLFDLPVWKVLVQYTPFAEFETLEYLASELDLLDTEAWKRAQSDEQRRYLIEQAHERHRTRGTNAALYREAAEAGGKIVRIIAPPNKFFLSSSYSVAERNAWLSQMPEIRLYPRRARGQKQAMHLGSAFIGGCLTRSDALVRSRLRVIMVKDGIETELESPDWEIASVQKEATTTIIIPGQSGRNMFVGRCIGSRFPGRTDSSQRRLLLNEVSLYTEQTAKLGLRTAQPMGLTPIHTDGEMIAEVHAKSPKSTFIGKGSFPRHTSPSRAYLYHYRRIKLHDPTAPVSRARASSHIGTTRLGMPPHHAHIDIEFEGQRRPRPGFFVGRPLVAHDHTPLQRLLASLRLAKRESDVLTISTKIHRPLLAGSHIIAGPDLIAGGLTSK